MNVTKPIECVIEMFDSKEMYSHVKSEPGDFVEADHGRAAVAFPSVITSGVVAGRICDQQNPLLVAAYNQTAPPVSIVNQIRKFNGRNYPVPEWTEQLRIVGEMYNVDPKTLAEMAVLTLEGEAWTTARLETVRGQRTLEDLARVLENTYGPTTYPGTLRYMFFQRIQLEWEDIPRYANALQILLEQACRRGEQLASMASRDLVLRDQFVMGLRDPYLNRSLRDLLRMNPALTFAEVKHEAIERSRGPTEETETYTTACRAMYGTSTPNSDTEELKQMVADLQKQVLQLTLDRQADRQARQQSSRPMGKCWTCGDPRHRANRCPQNSFQPDPQPYYPTNSQTHQQAEPRAKQRMEPQADPPEPPSRGFQRWPPLN